jgi:hypothetical protein
MVFIVLADGATGPVSVTCERPSEALEAALALSARGADDVLIDADGKHYAPTEFRIRSIGPDDESVTTDAA